jgi:hypothetical protein
MRKLLFLLSSVFLITFVLYSSGCSGTSQVQIETKTAITTQPVQTTTAITTTAEPAAFSVSNLTFWPDIIEPDEEFAIRVTVTNTGGIQGTYDVVLYIEGRVEQTRSVTLDAGASEEVEFRLMSYSMEGTYNVTVDELLRELEIG